MGTDKTTTYSCKATTANAGEDGKITFNSVSDLYKISVDGKVLDGYYNIANGGDAITLPSGYVVNKQLIVINPNGGSVSLSNVSDRGLVNITGVWNEAAVEVPTIAAGALNTKTTNAMNGTIYLYSTAKIALAVGTAGNNFSTATIKFNNIEQSGVTISVLNNGSTDLYVPLNAEVTLTSKTTNGATDSMSVAITGVTEPKTAKASAANNPFSVTFTASADATVTYTAGT